VHLDDARAREKWSSWGHEELITMSEKLAPSQLFQALVGHGMGWLHLDGLVLNRRAFERCGYFFEHLRLHQDSAFFIQLASVCQLHPGRLTEAVAMRRVHDHNRIGGANAATRALHFKTLFDWARAQQLEKGKLEILFQNHLYFSIASMRSIKAPIGYSAGLRNLLIDVLTHPHLSAAVVYRRMRKRLTRPGWRES
jgi:hypothetical protein